MRKHGKLYIAANQLWRKVVGDHELRLIRHAESLCTYIADLQPETPEYLQAIGELRRLSVRLETLAYSDCPRGYNEDARPLIERIDKLMPIPNRP